MEHKSTLTSLLSELGVGGAGFEKFTMTLAQRSHKLTGGSGLHRWQLIGVSPLRPSAADNRDTGAGPLSTTAPLLRLFISRGSGKKKKAAASGREENYGGRTEGRDGHVTQTSLTVELA